MTTPAGRLDLSRKVPDAAAAPLYAGAVARAIERLEYDFVAYQPSNIIAPIIKELTEAATGPRMLVVSREEEAVGIIGGAVLGGRSGAILMQDNGFGNSLTALTTFALAYHLPLLIVANTRGGLGEYNSMIHAISGRVPDILRAANIPVFELDRARDPSDWEETVYESGRHAEMTRRPVVTLLDFWGLQSPEDRS